MEVKLFANLAEIAGSRSLEVNLEDDATVAEALERIFDDVPALREEILDGDGTPNEHINILVSGSNVHHDEDGLQRTVESSDELAVFPPVSGG